MTTITTTNRIQSSYSVIQTKLWVTDCANCGIVFAIPEELRDRRVNDGRSFYCPNGHSLGWNETEADRQRKRAERLERDLKLSRDYADHVQDSLTAERKNHAATKGKLTKTKNRVAKGVCPCCNRSFVQLERHMASQHPDYPA